jgi:hypothetical protein
MADAPTKMATLQHRLKQRLQVFEDKVVPQRLARWIAFALMIVLFMFRIISYGGFFVVAYAMGIHLLYLLVTFLTPLSDPEGSSEADADGAALPSATGDEFKPYVPKMQEYKVWRSMTKVVAICSFLTLFDLFDIPVFWPILVIYFILLFVTQMAGRIQHMLKHKYVPWNSKKPRYVSKD